MTAIKNGIKCTLRTPWKTALFSAVLVLLSALLTVSLCVFSAVRAYLSDCDDYYHTIADLEYVGNEYPNGTVYDEDLVNAVKAHNDELNALIGADCVVSYETESNTVAVVDGLHRWDNYTLEPNRAVMRLSNQMYDSRYDMYLMIVTETFCSNKDYTGTLLYVRTREMPGNGGEKLESGKSYYTAGRFFKGQTNNPWYYAEEITFYDGDEELTLQPFTPADESDSEAYVRYGDIVRLNNDSCRVFYSASLEDYLPFHQQRITLKTGRLFTEEEYTSRAHVCVVSDRIAGAFGYQIGDRIRFQVFSSDENSRGSAPTVQEAETLFIHRTAMGAGALVAEFLTTLAASVAVGVMAIVLPNGKHNIDDQQYIADIPKRCDAEHDVVHCANSRQSAEIEQRLAKRQQRANIVDDGNGDDEHGPYRHQEHR